MIIKTETDNKTTFKVRVFLKSKLSANFRITKQKAGFKTEVEAKREEVKLKNECLRELMEIESRGVLFCDLLKAWYEHELRIKVQNDLRSQAVHDEYLTSMKKWFVEYLKRPAVDLNSYAVINVFEKMKQRGLCFQHMRRQRSILRNVFEFGIQSGMIPTMNRSPTMEVVLKKDTERTPEILTFSEIQTLLQKSYEYEHPWRRAWATALLTGMRSGELYALSWKDIDWESKSVTVAKSFNGKRNEIKCTKAGYWRQVPISSELEKVLKEQFQITGITEFVFERSRDWQKGEQARILRQFCFVHGLPSIKFHALRACFATQMLRQGVEAARVMKICGWKDLKTMQCYVRLAGIEIEGATEALKLFRNFAKTTQNLMTGIAV